LVAANRYRAEANMKTIMVRYRTKPEQADANVTLVRAVFEELRQSAPQGLSYASYRLADGVSFIHVVTHTEPNPLTALPAFKAFQAQLRERIEESPQVTELFTVGSFGSSPSPLMEG
jgi:quinol monooxygenase YgiN